METKLPIVTTHHGKVRGSTEGGVAVFLGIPYAPPPDGDRRFGPPGSPPRWDGTRDAFAYGATALQPAQEFTLIPEPIIPGENCLNLNVFTPDPGAADLPVLVWIHGGGFLSGCNASPWYRGSRFARDGVVLVSINYRLGVEGFLLLDDAPTNRGILDMIAALEWVQDNIAAFGGDPDHVTIGGQSAGGMACTTLLTIPRAQRLFQAAIAMSGAAPRQSCMSRAEAEAVTLRAAEHLGVRPTRLGLAGLTDERLLDLQVTLGGTMGAVGESGEPTRDPFSSTLPFAPIIDGDLVARAPLDAIRRGAGSDKTVLVGTTSEELNMVSAMLGATRDDVNVIAELERFGLAEREASAYCDAHGGEPTEAVLGQALTDRFFRVPAIRLAEARAEAAAPTYDYEFRWRSPGFGGLLGACHCLDVPFVFDNLDAPGIDTVVGANPPAELAGTMHRAWVDFVAHGAPGWPRYDLDRRPTMVFDTESTIVDDQLRSVRTLWEDAR